MGEEEEETEIGWDKEESKRTLKRNLETEDHQLEVRLQKTAAALSLVTLADEERNKIKSQHIITPDPDPNTCSNQDERDREEHPSLKDLHCIDDMLTRASEAEVQCKSDICL